MRRSKHIGLFLTVLVLCVLVCVSCVKREKGSTGRETEPVTEAPTETVRYNTEDTVVVTEIDTNKSQITVRSIDNGGKVYILKYSGGTSIQNKYGDEVLISRIEVGEIADVYYMSGTQKLIAMRESAEAWENSIVTNWDMDYDAMLMSIGGVNYRYDKNTFISSGKKVIDIQNISGVDTLSVRGIDRQIYSIVVKTGHGYIRLTDTANMVGGMVEVGTKIMTVITKDMVIVAPEGEFTLTASKNGKGDSVKITVVRDEELVVSLSGFDGDIEKIGAVKLNILPAGAKYNVFVDNVETDVSDVINLTYGVHELRITSDSYNDYTERIVISSIYMNKTVDFNNTGGTASEESTAETESATGTGNDSLVYINKPEGASVYVDGVYKGTIPLSVTKEAGSHMIILRQTGYQSVVYSVEFSDDTENVNLSLPDMEKLENGNEG